MECPVKEVDGCFVSGRMMANMITKYVDSVNRGSVPNISTAWEYVIIQEREKYYEKSIKQFMTSI